MADIEAGKIENDKDKNIIDGMKDDRRTIEDTTQPASAAVSHHQEVNESSTDQDPCIGMSEENKDVKEKEEGLDQPLSDSGPQQMCSSLELGDTRKEQSHNSEVDQSKGLNTEITNKTTELEQSKGLEVMEKTMGASSEIEDLAERNSVEIMDKTSGAMIEIEDKSDEPCTEITEIDEEPFTEIKHQDEPTGEISLMEGENVAINKSIPQPEVTALEQKFINKEESMTEQRQLSKEVSPLMLHEQEKESQPEEQNKDDVEMTDDSELRHPASEAAVKIVCEDQLLKLPKDIPVTSVDQDKNSKDMENIDPLRDDSNKNSDVVLEDLSSSLESKKEHLEGTNQVNETDPKSGLISADTLQLRMEVDNESVQSETAMYDTTGPATPASSIVDTGSVSAGPTPSKRSRQNSTGSGANVEAVSDDLENHTFPASKVFEYQWPKDSSGEYYMLQEQISEFLAVKSFKRKYPELQRRPVEMNERMFLREKGAVTETQCDLGLTAIRSDEVYDLMHRDYPDKYAEYAAVLHERERQTIKEKHKDYEVPKLEKSKMTEYIKKAMKSASEWNTVFLRERKEERKAYFDLQTFNVHYPAGRFKVLPADLTSPSPYPVTLIPGQYQDYYKNHSPEELKYLPLNTALYNPPKQMGNSLANPQEVLSEDASEEDAEAGGASDSESDDDSSSGESDDSSGQDSGQMVEDLAKGEKGQDDLTCRMCEKQGEADEDMVQCSECKKFGHPTCLDLTTEMVTVIKTYPWQCMECKTCVECMDPYDEDKMIFCDRCDRGYHTFCVGLRSIPNGQWKCRSCKSPDAPRTPKSSSKIRGRGRKRGNNTPAKEG
ncbi:PHD finger protein 10-like [Ylistrum balloti]|uniref:PHD finger protein 10-like n=1 Tax=Ylistrum balloti TaxID=509963 RepID=UPI002905E99F|nr:PHD finger protein 10-like [Ylistrum balloti]